MNKADAAMTQKLMRVTCWKCGYEVALSKHGKFRRHAAARGGYAKRGTRGNTNSLVNICPMSGREYVPTTTHTESKAEGE